MLVSCCLSKVMSIQFYLFMHGNYRKFEVMDWEIENISGMINSRNMKFFKNLSNRNTLKVAKFGVRSICCFEAIKNKFSEPRAKLTPLRKLNWVKRFWNQNNFQQHLLRMRKVLTQKFQNLLTRNHEWNWPPLYLRLQIEYQVKTFTNESRLQSDLLMTSFYRFWWRHQNSFLIYTGCLTKLILPFIVIVWH